MNSCFEKPRRSLLPRQCPQCGIPLALRPKMAKVRRREQNFIHCEKCYIVIYDVDS